MLCGQASQNAIHNSLAPRQLLTLALEAESSFRRESFGSEFRASGGRIYDYENRKISEFRGIGLLGEAAALRTGYKRLLLDLLGQFGRRSKT